jgi:hypothetical protein
MIDNTGAVISLLVVGYVGVCLVGIVGMLILSKVKYGTWWPGPFL